MLRLAIFSVFIALLSSSNSGFTQCSHPIFKTQQELNDFFGEHMSCDTFIGDLKLSDIWLATDSRAISDLSPLQNIEVIDGDINIQNCNRITSLDSLKSLKVVTGNIHFYNNIMLSSIDKLSGIQFDQRLTLSSLGELDSLPLFNADSLIDLTLFHLPINNINSLETIKQLERLTISNCDNLKSLNGIENISIDKIGINHNDSLSDCTIESICKIIEINAFNANISNNMGNCASSEDVANLCFPDSTFCLRTSFFIKNQTELNKLALYPEECLYKINKIEIDETSVTDPIVDLSSLSRFDSLDRLEISNTSVLSDFSGTGNITFVEDLIINNNKRLKSVFGLNPTLRTKTVNIEGNTVLKDLPHCLENHPPDEVAIISQDSIAPLEIRKLSFISSMEIKNSRFAVEYFLEDNTQLSYLKLDGLTGVDSINFGFVKPGFTSLIIYNCPDLSKVTNINFQDSVNRFSISRNHLSQLSIEKTANHFNSFSFSDPILKDISFTNYPTSISSFSASYNGELEEINFLDSLVFINDFNVVSNDSLKSIGTTNSLISDVEEIFINGNPELVNLMAFDDDLNVDLIIIRENPKLNDCAVKVVCNSLNDPTIQLNLYNNSPGCSQDSILFYCFDIKNPLFDVEIRTQEDINQLAHLYPEMDSIYGSLTFYRTGYLDLDISFFKQLKYIEGKLSFWNYTNPYDLNYSSLDSCYYSSLEIHRCDFERLPIYHGSDTLISIGLYDFTIDNLDLGFDGLKVVTNFLNVSRNSNEPILDLRFNELEYVHELNLSNLNFNIQNFPELSAVFKTRMSNQIFSNLDFVSTLEIENSLSVTHSDNLKELSLLPFENKDLPHLSLQYCDSLVSIAGFNETKNCNTNISLYSNKNLENIYLFEKADSISGLSISNHTLIDSIRFPLIKKAGNLSFFENESLKSIAFDSLESANSIRISENPLIQDISNIRSAADVKDLKINQNSSLEDCNLDLVCNNFNLSNNVEIFRNLGICEYQASVLSYCGIDSDYDCLLGNITFNSFSSLQNYLQFYDECDFPHTIEIDLQDDVQIDTIIFKGLRKIKGLRIINTNAKCLIFENLTSVSNSIIVTDTLLERLELKQLEYLGFMTVENCHNLRFIDLNNEAGTALTGIKYPNSYGFTIRNNRNLEEVNLNRIISFGVITISNNPNLNVLHGIIEGENYYQINCSDNESLVSGLVFKTATVEDYIELVNLSSIAELPFEGEITAPNIELSGLHSIDSFHIELQGNKVETLKISNNENLKYVSGLKNDSINSWLYIEHNPSLVDLDIFTGDSFFAQNITINNNDRFRDINLTFDNKIIERIIITENDNLVSITGLDSTQVTKSLVIENNSKLNNIDIYKDDTNIYEVFIGGSDSLKYLNIKNLNVRPDFALVIRNMKNLKTIDGFAFDVMRALHILENPALEEINFINDSLSIWHIVFSHNPIFNNCISPLLCNNITFGNSVNITSNGENCENIDAVSSACFTSTEDIGFSSSTILFPNPTTGIINYTSDRKIDKLELYALDGRAIPIVKNRESIDISNLNRGEYILKVIYPDGTESLKIVKI